MDETIADITAVWDELNNRSAELEHLLSCGKEDSSFERSINVISEHVDSMETVLVEERVPSDLVTAESFLKEHKVRRYVRIYICTYIAFVIAYINIHVYVYVRSTCLREFHTYVHAYVCM